MHLSSSIWHPCSKLTNTFPMIHIKEAKGGYLIGENNKIYLDAISSWWCKSLGHNDERIKNKLINQLEKFEHVIFSDTTNAEILTLSNKLVQFSPHLEKVFYASDGSSAVEIALKLSLHAKRLSGESHRTKFIALKNGYHGDTVGAMSVSDEQQNQTHYQKLLFKSFFVEPIYVNHLNDKRWENVDEYWEALENKLNQKSETVAAVIVEPLVQGASGMKFYSADFLKRLFLWTRKNNIYFIADEIMTGMGRLGKMLASDYAKIQPDLICLSKGLTAGWMPFSAVLVSQQLFRVFSIFNQPENLFLHSHTFSGHVLGASIANEVINIIEKDCLCEKAILLGNKMHERMIEIQKKIPTIAHVRQLGALIAFEVIDPKLNMNILAEKALKAGILLRPLGQTLYWMPPLNSDDAFIDRLAELTLHVLS